ncbi:MAG: DUF1349 domain-containing protein [Bacteroidota bacterium]
MRTPFAILGLWFSMLSCQPTSPPNTPAPMPGNNLFSGLTNQEIGSFSWMNEPQVFSFENGSLSVVALKGTDFFNNPEDSSLTATAPYLYQEVSGDFVATALVSPGFASMWNAACLMVHMDEQHWIKFAFEKSDATGKSIVTVVTRGVSDDANGVRLSKQDQVWLRLIRKGDVYSLLWSLDGQIYKMARLCAMPAFEKVKIGLEMQCPVGAPALHLVHFFGLEKKTVKDLRKGE